MVAFPTAAPRDGEYTFSLECKGAFSAALKTGAAVFPAIYFLQESRLVVGRAIYANATSVPEMEHVQTFCKEYATALSCLYDAKNKSSFKLAVSI